MAEPRCASDDLSCADKELVRIRTVYDARKDSQQYSRFSSAHLFAMQERERRVLDLLRKLGLSDLSACRVLDVGCGTGEWLRSLIQWGALPDNLTGLDLLAERVDLARATLPSGVALLNQPANPLPFPSESFDLVLQSTVFTSILDKQMRKRIASEMIRVVRTTGAIVWYDYRVNNPSNPDVRRVGRRELNELFEGCEIETRSITLAPPIARRLTPLSWLSCHALERLPFLRTHYLGLIRKRTPQTEPSRVQR